MKVAVLGYGSRGKCYADLFGKEAEISAVCDIRQERLHFANENTGLKDDRLYLSDDAFLAQEKLADLLVVATPDDCHCRHAIAALEKGYDLLLEKPIACTEEDCRKIYDTARKTERKVFVCHVLRYAPFFSEIKRELDTGAYGRISTVELTENVSFWHQAHSFVRGNWGNTDASTPMIIAKCCHDLDMLSWLVGNTCNYVSSMGNLRYFTRENAPANSAERCEDCPVNDCPYNAVQWYLAPWGQKDYKGWPVNVVATHPTRENILQALHTGPYGRCVYKCDNNAVDHQVVNMLFEGGTTAHLTMTAFSKENTRNIHVHGEKGEIYGNMHENKLHCAVFGGESKIIDTATLSDGFGHGGGDEKMVNDILASYRDNSGKQLTSISHSMMSHFIGFAAERSRLQNGALQIVKP